MNDVTTKGFFKRQQLGEIFNNPMTRVKQTRNAGGGVYHSVFSTAGKPSFGDTYDSVGGSVTLKWMTAFPTLIHSLDLSDIDISNGVAIAKLQCLSDIDKTPYSFMEDAAEITSTLHLLRSPLKSALQLTRTFEHDYKLRRKRGYPHAKALADAWLTVRYGFRPLLYSINSGIDAMVKLKQPPRRRTSRGYWKDETSHQGTSTSNYGSGSSASMRWEDSFDISIRTGILYEMTNPLMKLNQALGFRAKDVPATVYELMPYSWVIDRFVNLTQVVHALMNLADPHVRILAAWEKTETSSIVKHQALSQTDPNWISTVAGDVVTDILISEARTPWLPSTADAQPVLNVRVDAAFVGDLASLALQRLKLGSFSSR
jgi:hypothetical protein